MENTKNSLHVYYDGLCRLCSKEIDHYKMQTGAESISFVDITQPGFRPEEHGLDGKKVHKVMHVKKPDGTLITEVDAFVEIWKILPKYQWAVPLAQNKIVHPILTAGYKVFAQVRPFLPKKKNQCADSPYCEISPKVSSKEQP
jgi:predicted DCC family thiol-disulfide oxidoreductase YuxK